MLSFAMPGQGKTAANWSGRPTASSGTQVTGGSSHTLGASFTDLFAATAFDSYWIEIGFWETVTATTQTDQLFNIYAGSAGNEQVIIPNLQSGWSNGVNLVTPARYYQFPVFIPAGTRLSAKMQALIASDTVRARVTLIGGPPLGWFGTAVECLGANTAASQGVSVTPGTTSEGTFTDIGTTAHEWGYVAPSIQGTLTDTAMSNNEVGLDIGVGGSALPGLEDWTWMLSSAECSTVMFGIPGRYCRIGSGVTLQARTQSVGSVVEPHDVCIYGVY